MSETFEQALASCNDMGPDAFKTFAASIEPEWIEQALTATGTASVRRRKLPAGQVLWLILGMCLYSDRCIRDVCDHLRLVLPTVKKLAASALPKARYNLGSEPLKWLFYRYAETYAVDPARGRFAGLSLFAVDGTCVVVPDTDANFEAFDKPSARGDGNDSGYPQVRVAALMNLDTRMLVDAAIGGYRTSEIKLSRKLWERIEDNSITLLDRGFADHESLCGIINSGARRHVLVRFPKHRKFSPDIGFPDGSLGGHIPRPRSAPKHLPAKLEGRIIHYKHPDGKEGRLFTTITDIEEGPADRLVELYHQRWDIEMAFDELKTHLRYRREALRSKKPEGVYQELWGLFLLYNLVRYEMLGAADAHNVHPNRISFWSSLHVIRHFWMMSAMTSSPGNIPKQLVDFHSTFNALVLPKRRPDRRFPRRVKIKMSHYLRKRNPRPPKQIDERQDGA